jgi:STE24 endopeptidase
MRRYGRRWWAPGAVVVVVFGAVSVYAGPVVLDPLFNRFTELPEGQTRSDVLALAREAGGDVGEVYEIDASRRTTAANAYVTGLGDTKRVVLYDTLLDNFTRDELRLVVAHELAHVHHRDVPRGLLWLAIVAPLGMLAAARLTERFAGPGTKPQRSIPALALSLALVVPVTTAISNQLSRRVEARADSYALRLTEAPQPFIGFEQRIAKRNVSDPDPPAWRTWLLATHPPVVDRIGIGVAFQRGRR